MVVCGRGGGSSSGDGDISDEDSSGGVGWVAEVMVVALAFVTVG